MTVVLSEKNVASTLGLSRDEIKKIRAEYLTDPDHFSMKSREIVYTDEGIEELKLTIASLRAKNAARAIEPPPIASTAQGEAVVSETEASYEDAEDSIKSAAEVMPDVLEEIVKNVERRRESLKVVSTPRNPKIVFAARDNGETVRVLVQSNKNFLPQMPIEAMPVQGDLFELVGRCPRFRGRY